MQRSDDLHRQFKKSPYISAAKPKNFIIFAFTYAPESSALFYGDFCMISYSVDSNEAVNQGDGALNASSPQF
jgi:hypothetical protein